MVSSEQNSNRLMNLALLCVGTLLVISAVGFGVYYYYDRYLHPDEAVLERQARHLEALVQKNPQNADLRVATANYYFESGLLADALRECQEALKINPDHQDALVLLGRIYAQQGELETAVTQFKRVVELNRDNPMANADPRLEFAYYELGSLYSQQGKYPEAVDALQRALKIDATDADARYLLGVVYQKQNDHEGAVREFNEALRFVPDFIECYEGLAASYTAMGKKAEATYAQAMILIFKGNSTAAAAQLEEVLEQEPNLTRAYLGLGLAYEKIGKREDAKAALEKYLAAFPTDVAAKQALGRVSQESKP